MTVATQVVRDLLENGVHFGHQTNKWNPKMKKYIFGEKNGIYIIDLKKTEEILLKAADFLYNLALSGKKVLFVGTKKQAKEVIKAEALRCGMFYVDERWLGGCLTNFMTIRNSVNRLNDLQTMKLGEVYATLAKKEKARIDNEEKKLLKNLAGIKDMRDIPDCVVIVDAEAENTAIREAVKIKKPVIGLIDTNCDPTNITYPIPGNDDAIRSIRYVVSTLASAIAKGAAEYSGKTNKIITEKVSPGVPETKVDQKIEQPAVKESKEEPAAKEKPEEKPVKPAKMEEVHAREKKAAEVKEEVVEGDIKLDNLE